MIRKFTEAELKTVGGLSYEHDRRYKINELAEMLDFALEAVPRFREALAHGRGVGRWLEMCRNFSTHMREANSETTLGFLLRKGIQTEAIGWYELSERVWQQYCAQNGSTTVAEWYGPLYHTTIPGPVERGDRFPSAAITGENSVIRNIVFGQVVPIDRTLFDDDQTGQIAGYAKKLGDGMGVLESVWSSSRAIGSARTYANVNVPASEYTTKDVLGNTITGPFSTQLYDGTGSSGNRPTTYGQLTLPRLARGYVQSLNAVDPMRNKIVVRLNKLVCSSQDSINGKVLLAPGPWPAVLGQGDTSAANQGVLGGTTTYTGLAANQGVNAGYPGGWGSPNPFSGMGITLVVERYLPDWAWFLIESGKGIIFQTRDELEISEESRNTGSYFDFDVIRYRSRKRFNVDWVGGGSRFAYLGNDGTVSGSL